MMGVINTKERLYAVDFIELTNSIHNSIEDRGVL